VIESTILDFVEARGTDCRSFYFDHPNFHMHMAPGRLGFARALVNTHFNFESAKTGLFLYVVLKQSLKASRHLRARGLTQTAREFWGWISQVRCNHTAGLQLTYLSHSE
jgi:hypothetical protein